MDFVTKDGEVIKVDATAAYLNVARQRLKDLGITKLATPDSDIAKLMKEMTAHPIELPPLSTEPDEATDGVERFAESA